MGWDGVGWDGIGWSRMGVIRSVACLWLVTPLFCVRYGALLARLSARF